MPGITRYLLCCVRDPAWTVVTVTNKERVRYTAEGKADDGESPGRSPGEASQGGRGCQGGADHGRLGKLLIRARKFSVHKIAVLKRQAFGGSLSEIFSVAGRR